MFARLFFIIIVITIVIITISTYFAPVSVLVTGMEKIRDTVGSSTRTPTKNFLFRAENQFFQSGAILGWSSAANGPHPHHSHQDIP